METVERNIRIALADIGWEAEIDADPQIQAELDEERQTLEQRLLTLMYDKGNDTPYDKRNDCKTCDGLGSIDRHDRKPSVQPGYAIPCPVCRSTT